MSNPTTPSEPTNPPSISPAGEQQPASLATTLLAGAGLILFGFLIGFVVILIRASQEVDFRSIYVGLDGLRLPIAVGLASIVAFVLVLVCFRPRLKTIALVGLVLLSVGGIFRSLFRIESFYGNMIPRLAWRWTPSAEEEFNAYLASVTPVSRGDLSFDETLDLGEPSPSDHLGFLGNTRDGVVSGIRLEPRWDVRQPKQLWRHPIGLGWAGFAVSGTLAVTQEQRGDLETIVGYDLRSGREIWTYEDAVRFADEHGDGPRTTPAINATHVFCVGATGVLTCLDKATGKLAWRRETLENPAEQNLLWGMSGSPLLMDDLVVVTPGAGTGKSIMGFHQTSGELVWSGGNSPAAYASPADFPFAGLRQILSFNGTGLCGYDEQGTELWSHPWLTQGESQRVNVAQPIVVTPNGPAAENVGFVLVSSGYGVGTALLRVAQDQGEWIVDEVWKSKQLKSKMSNFVVHGDHIYGLDNGILTCLQLKDGEQQWKRGRYGHGQLLLVEDHLLIQAESGEVILVAADPQEFQELGRFEALTDKTWNHAALAGNILVVRNNREAAAYELPLRE